MLSSFKCSNMSFTYASLAIHRSSSGCLYRWWLVLTWCELTYFMPGARRVLRELRPVKSNARTYEIAVIDVLVPFRRIAPKKLWNSRLFLSGVAREGGWGPRAALSGGWQLVDKELIFYRRLKLITLLSYNSFQFMCLEALDWQASLVTRHVAVEWANWWNDYSKVWVKSSVLKHPSVCLQIRFFNTLGGKLCPSPTPSSPAKTISPSQSKVLWTKERDDIWPQTSKHCCSSSSRYILPLSKCGKKGPEWNHCK